MGTTRLNDTKGIIVAIEGLTAATSYSPWTYFLAVLLNVITVITGAIAAYHFTNKHWKRVQKRETVSKRAGEICTLIQDYNAIVVDYWSHGYEEARATEISIREMEIKNQTLLLQSLSRQFRTHISDDDRTLSVLSELHDQLFEAAAGGEFETKSRQANIKKAARVSQLLTKAKIKVSGYCHKH